MRWHDWDPGQTMRLKPRQEVRIIAEPAIAQVQVMMQVYDEETDPEWATNVIQYLKK